jgi:hypothetical protein
MISSRILRDKLILYFEKYSKILFPFWVPKNISFIEILECKEINEINTKIFRLYKIGMLIFLVLFGICSVTYFLFGKQNIEQWGMTRDICLGVALVTFMIIFVGVSYLVLKQNRIVKEKFGFYFPIVEFVIIFVIVVLLMAVVSRF